jgi:Protein of unknown function (DUF3263)
MGTAEPRMLVFAARSEQACGPMNANELTARERALIDFEREWWKLGSRKDVGIRTRFDVSASSYYRALQGLLDRPAAMEYDSMTILRLRKRREQARRGRIEGRRADPSTR